MRVIFFSCLFIKSFRQIKKEYKMYGITDKIRIETLKKIDKQKKYLDTHFFHVGNDTIKMSDLVKNAYINSKKYIAEINNRVYSLNQYALDNDLVPIFGTITLPTEYHKYKTAKNGKLISNPKYANKHLKNDIEKIYDIKTKKETLTNEEFEKYSPNGGSKKLSRMFKSLLDLRIYRNIPKEQKCYFRVYEPHKNGTPHLHFSMFVPKDKIDKVVDTFKNYFINNYPTLRTDFQTDIKNPVAYLMKYILKTFDDLRTDKSNISDLSLWYISNKITRFYTSRTLISLEIFRKLNGRYNLLELTQMYKDNEITVLLDSDTNKLVSIYDSMGNIYNKKEILLLDDNESKKCLDELKKRRLELKKKGTIYKRLKNRFNISNKKTPIYIDSELFYLIDSELIKPQKFKSVSKYSNYELIDYFNHLDNNIDSVDNMQHYALVKNEMIKRDFLNDDYLDLNNYNYTSSVF
jgi:hypothetical protein